MTVTTATNWVSNPCSKKKKKTHSPNATLSSICSPVLMHGPLCCVSLDNKGRARTRRVSSRKTEGGRGVLSFVFLYMEEIKTIMRGKAYGTTYSTREIHRCDFEIQASASRGGGIRRRQRINGCLTFASKAPGCHTYKMQSKGKRA